MTKIEFVKAVASKTDATQKDVSAMISAMSDVIIEALKSGDSFKFGDNILSRESFYKPGYCLKIPVAAASIFNIVDYAVLNVELDIHRANALWFVTVIHNNPPSYAFENSIP